jgi:hypothetical protein
MRLRAAIHNKQLWYGYGYFVCDQLTNFVDKQASFIEQNLPATKSKIIHSTILNGIDQYEIKNSYTFLLLTTIVYCFKL